MSCACLYAVLCAIAAQPTDILPPRLVIQSAETYTSATFSADGKWLLTGSDDRTARIWDATSGLELRKFAGHTNDIRSVSLSANGERVATVSEDKTLRLWSVDSAAELFRTEFPVTPRMVVFSADSEQILVAEGLNVRLLNAADGSELFLMKEHTRASPEITAFGWQDHVSAVAFARNGKSAATAGSDGLVVLWDLETRKVLRRIRALKLPANFPSIKTLTFTADDQQIFTYDSNSALRMWDVATGRELKSITPPGRIMAAAIDQTGKKIVTGGDQFDMTVQIWDVDSGKLLHKLKGHESGLSSVSFSADGKRIVSTCGHGAMRTWNAEKGTALQSIVGRTLFTHLAEISPNNKRIAVACAQPMRTTLVWNAESGGEITRFIGHTRGVSALGFSPDGTLVVTGAGDDTARIWEADTGKERLVLRVGDSTNSASFSPDARHILTQAENSKVTVWTATDGKVEMQFGFTLNAAAYSPDGKQIVAGGYDGTMQQNELWTRIWNVGSRKQINQLPYKQAVHAVAFSPDGKQVAVGYYDGTARVWNVESGKEQQVLKGHTSQVVSVAFSPDGKQLVTGSWDNTARIWNLGAERKVKILRGHSHNVRTARFSADGKRILTGSDDRTVRVWDSETGNELCQLVSFRKGWAVIDSEGRYDAANPENVDGLHAEVGMKPVPIGELREAHYDPGLLAKHLGWNKQPLRVLGMYIPKQP